MESAQQLPGLDDFLTALRFEGIPIGPQELVWLHHTFSNSRQWPRCPM